MEFLCTLMAGDMFFLQRYLIIYSAVMESKHFGLEG